MRALLLTVALCLGGCSSAIGPGGMECDAKDAGGYADCAATDQGGRIIYIEGFTGEIGIPATDETPEMVIKITEAESFHLLEGPAINATAAEQDAIGAAIGTLAETVSTLVGGAAGP